MTGSLYAGLPQALGVASGWALSNPSVVHVQAAHQPVEGLDPQSQPLSARVSMMIPQCAPAIHIDTHRDAQAHTERLESQLQNMMPHGAMLLHIRAWLTRVVTHCVTLKLP
eukprot:TRINITY_DN5686_c0_g1_i2.p3 TRINITY_DN5686_c0_g1~~TRINITY_DN5686_c0_g1_i2.p3  ORF type:complete len:111 (+),score=3.04 TRINITY_DN5686_c0_g1_i2:640-972(+)